MAWGSEGRKDESRRDARLVRAVVRRGSRDAADALVRRHYDEVYRYCARQLHDADGARDLTQDVFIAALRALPRFDARRASFRTWLFHIATNRLTDYWRMRRPPTVPVESVELEDFAAARPVLDETGLLARLDRTLATGDARVAEVVRLRIFGEMGFREIATETGQSEAAVKSQYHRFMQRFRAELERDAVGREEGGTS